MKQDNQSILVVDDDANVRKIVARALEPAGFEMFIAADAASARALLSEQDFALVILDVNLPDASGIELCDEIRQAYDLPIVMLTVVADEGDVVRALDAGADDYVRKPFGTQELLARVRAVLRRSQIEDSTLQGAISAGPLQLDSSSYRAQIGGELLPLTPTEYRLLAFLVQNAGRVLTHDQLLHFVWGTGYEGEHHMLRVTMSRLRQKLGRHTKATELIRTMPGVGYEFVAQSGAA